MNKFVAVSAVAVCMAVIDSVGGMLGLWSVTGGDTQRLLITAFEALTMLLLLGNSVAIRQSIVNDPALRHLRVVATLSTLSLLVCLGGDLVNFNLPQTYFRHGEVIKHDYLADSVWFFAPGYSLLIAAVAVAIRKTGRGLGGLYAAWAVAAVVGVATLYSMCLPDAGSYVLRMTGGYSVIITAVGFTGGVLIWAFGGMRAPAGIWWVGAGVILANLADAVIGQFWIYGNRGDGFFPIAREVNWIMYVGSQALVIHLPRVVAASGRIRSQNHHPG